MRHFIGGFSFGWIMVLLFSRTRPKEPSDVMPFLVGAAIASSLFGLATWGLLP